MSRFSADKTSDNPYLAHHRPRLRLRRPSILRRTGFATRLVSRDSRLAHRPRVTRTAGQGRHQLRPNASAGRFEPRRGNTQRPLHLRLPQPDRGCTRTRHRRSDGSGCSTNGHTSRHNVWEGTVGSVEFSRRAKESATARNATPSRKMWMQKSGTCHHPG